MNIMLGVVKDGKVELTAPLPDGTKVEVHPLDPTYEMPPEFWEELHGWQLAGAKALDLVEKLAEETEHNETGRSVEGDIPHSAGPRTSRNSTSSDNPG
jgi:hypothetical protein